MTKKERLSTEADYNACSDCRKCVYIFKKLSFCGAILICIKEKRNILGIENDNKPCGMMAGSYYSSAQKFVDGTMKKDTIIGDHIGNSSV